MHNNKIHSEIDFFSFSYPTILWMSEKSASRIYNAPLEKHSSRHKFSPYQLMLMAYYTIALALPTLIM